MRKWAIMHRFDLCGTVIMCVQNVNVFARACARACVLSMCMCACAMVCVRYGVRTYVSRKSPAILFF